MPEASAQLDLDDLARTLRRRALPVLGAAALAGVLATAGLAFLGKYSAEAIVGLGTIDVEARKAGAQAEVRSDVKLPQIVADLPQVAFNQGIALPEYKTLAPRLAAKAFAEYAALRGDVDPVLRERIERDLGIEDRRRQLLLPVYSSTRIDVRELGEGPKLRENEVLGLRIAHGSRDRERALAVVGLVGEFVEASVFRSTALDLVAMRAREHEARRLLAQNQLGSARFAIAQLEVRGRTLERLRSANPDLGKVAPQQVVSVADGGARYLAPATQVVGVESTLAELRERVAFADRQVRKAALQQDFYRRMEELVATQYRPAKMIEEMHKLVGAAFPSGPDPDGAIAEARNEVLLDMLQIVALHERGLQFLAAPAIVERDPVVYIKVGLGAAAAALVASFALVLAAVWWRSGRARAQR
jgi:hypothetical protein